MSSFINDCEGYPDAIFIGPVMGDLKCGICFEVMKNAQEVCREAHLFCLSCINKVASKQCPTCRGKVSIKPAVAVNRMILQLPVKCYMSDSGCGWRGELGNIEKHKAECGFVDISCTFTDCVARMQRRHQADHETTCDHRLACCDFCSAYIKVSSIDEHKTSKCPNRPAVCDKGCGEIFSLNLKSTHAQVCPLEVIDCPCRYLINCSFSCERKDMPLHTADISFDHLNRLTTAATELKKSNHELKQSNNVLKQNNDELTTALIEFKQSNKKRKRGDDSLEAENVQSIDFSWEIPYLFDKRKHDSPEFIAFGHTVYLRFREEIGANAGYYGIYLHMRSRIPDKLGFKFIVGRPGMEGNATHSITQSSDRLLHYPAAIDEWKWGIANMALTSNLTTEMYLTADETLYIKALVYKATP